MVFTQLPQEKYKHFTQQLIKKAHQEPLNASFDTTMIINNTEYILKVQPGKKHRIYVLQALMVERQECGHIHTLILNNGFLLALLRILISQGIR